MKLFRILAVFSVIFCACGKDSSTAGSGQASAQSTYTDQCTYRKKVTNRATNLTNDEVFYERSISWGPDLTNTFTDYENKSYSTNSSGTIQPGTKIYYGKGRNKLVHLNETDYEITDIFYDTDSSFNQNGTTPSVSVRVWRKDSSSQRTLISNRSDGAYKALDMVKTLPISMIQPS